MASLRRENGRDEPWKVPFFGIGNEAWGCGGNMRAEDYAALARQYSTYVRDQGGDPGNTVTRIAAGASDDDFAWTEALMRAVKNLEGRDGEAGPYQAISMHYYTMSGPWEDKGSATEFSQEEWYRTLSRAARAEELVARHSTVMDHYDPHKKVGLVFDEWGTWWNVEPGTNPGFLYQQNTVRDALVASIHFDGFHRHADRLIMANIAQTVNVLQAMILTDPESGALVLTPTYHVFAIERRAPGRPRARRPRAAAGGARRGRRARPADDLRLSVHHRRDGPGLAVEPRCGRAPHARARPARTLGHRPHRTRPHRRELRCAQHPRAARCGRPRRALGRARA